uniref:Uncharacterized protein n=1 Tax=Salix viminalis TaxID=40686 RepID=A0A6N2N7M5_SALVM
MRQLVTYWLDILEKAKRRAAMDLFSDIVTVNTGKHRLLIRNLHLQRAENFKEPYKVLCDGTFLHHLIVNNIAPVDTTISNIFDGSVKLFTSRAERLGNLILNLFRQLIAYDCKNAEVALEIIGEITEHFFVGTQILTCGKVSGRHARSEKLMKRNRLQVMLNRMGRIENMDEETHAERHARTVALAQANGRLRFKPVSKSFNAGSKDCSKMVILHASNDNKTQAAIARLEALKNDYTGMETVEAVDDDESSLEDDVYIQKKQKDIKRKTRQVKALENARKAPRNFLELLHEGCSLKPNSNESRTDKLTFANYILH